MTNFGVHDVLRRLARDATSYLEIGVQEGESLRTVVAAAPSLMRLALCDTYGPTYGGTNRGSHAHIADMLESLAYTGRVSYLDGLSQVELAHVAHEQFDLAFVDGDHSYACALSDMTAVWPLCLGSMVVHDISYPDVWDAVRAFGMSVRASASVHFGDHGTIVFARS